MGMDRRGFLKMAAMAGALSQAAGCRSLGGLRERAGLPMRKGVCMAGFRAAPLGRVRVGVVGVGQRGSAAVPRLAEMPNTAVVALSDLYEERVARSAKSLAAAGKPAPALHFGSKDEWRKLCESPEVDLVYICTPWLWHTPMAVYAMRCGKHVAVEVPAAVTVEQCWQLVDTAEQTQRHCMMLENCCYGENELLALTLCRKGVLGDLTHGEAGYIHDCRKLLFAEDPDGHPDGQWRLEWAKQHTGNAYPTHGLGPVCQYMDINRGDRFERLTSASSNPVGLARTAAEKYGKNSREAKTTYAMGDMNTSLLRTYRGRTVLVQYSTVSPRPYSRINLISGTKGTLADFPLRVALDPKADEWMGEKELAGLRAKYAHPLWQAGGAAAQKAGGHGGMDYVMDLRLCHCLQHGLPLDIDVYDTALWSSLVELSEWSVQHGGRPVDVPDFTRGGWKTAEPIGLVTV